METYEAFEPYIGLKMDVLIQYSVLILYPWTCSITHQTSLLPHLDNLISEKDVQTLAFYLS